MLGTFRLAVLVPVLMILPLASAQLDGQANVDKAQIRAKLLAGPSIEGKLTEVKLEDDLGQVTVQFTHQIKRRVDPFALQKVEGLKILYEKVLETKIEEAIQKVGEELAKAQLEAADTIDVPIPFVLSVAKNVKLRTMMGPLGEDGKPKKLTPEEQRKLKGDPSLPGFIATERDFEIGNPVRFYIDRSKFRPGSAKPAKGKDDNADKTVYPITMLVILQPPKTAKGENPFFKK